MMCAQCSSKLNEHVRAIQYATEALQYNKIDSNALLCRAKSFEIEKLYVQIWNAYHTCFAIVSLF